MNETLLGSVGALCGQLQVIERWWGEAMIYTDVLLNFIATQILVMHTTHRVLFENVAKNEKIRIFGCTVYSAINRAAECTECSG